MADENEDRARSLSPLARNAAARDLCPHLLSAAASSMARCVRAHGMSATLIGERDSDLLRTLYDKYANALRSYVVRLNGGDRVKAQDVVQETMLRAWRNGAVLERAGGAQRGWLFTVARHIVIDEWRSTRGYSELVTDQISEQPVDDAAQRTVDRQLVLAALRTLSTEHRQVLLECYFRGASTAEAARILGVPHGTVKSRIHYALHALRRALDEIGGLA